MADTSQVPPEAAKDSLQERLIDAEYKIWKKNTPYLYDFVLTHSLEWPSLTCQWLPTKRILSKKCVEHQLLLGTHTMGEQNYLMVATALLPSNDDEVVVGEVSSLRYDEEKKEVGGFGLAGPNVGKIDIKMKIKHEGEVNRARYMPQNHFIVATRGPSPELYVWDLSKHPSMPDPKAPPFAPQGVCFGHDKEGYALAWSPFQEGKLLSGGDDATVLLFDAEQAYKDKKVGTHIKGPKQFRAHTKAVEDVAWHCKDSNMAGSVGDDRLLCIWDVRDCEKPAKLVKDAHKDDINCIAFNPTNEFVLATGSADNTIAIWDLRDVTKPIANLEGHTDQVFKLEWAPFNESILGSCSADRRVALWDLSRIGQEQTPEDAEDGPPELLFLHGGHTSKVSEFSWNSKTNWSVASVSEDNVLQVWSPVEEIYADEDDDEADEKEASADLPDSDLE